MGRMLNLFKSLIRFAPSQTVGRSQAQLRTWPTLIAVLIVAIAAYGAIVRLNQMAENSTQSRLLLTQTKEHISRLNALEWEALSKQTVDENLSEELAENQLATEAIFTSLRQLDQNETQLARLFNCYQKYRTAIYREIDLIAQGEIATLSAATAMEIDAIYDDLYAEVSSLEQIYIAEKQYTRAYANAGVAASMILSVSVIGFLFHEFSKQLWNKTKALERTLKELERTQHQMIQQEKMAALGQLIAGIAHEINNPLGVIKASASNTQSTLTEALMEMPQMCEKLNIAERTGCFQLVAQAIAEQSFVDLQENRALKRKITTQLKDKGITNARYMAELLTEMGVDHIPDFLMPLLKSEHNEWAITFANNLTNVLTNNRMIVNAVDRSSKIVFALKNYARFERNGDRQPVQITKSIDIVLELYHNQIKRSIELVRDYESVPEILGYPDELIQVWTNLIHNAIQAMPHGGTLTIQTRQVEENGVEVGISDTGNGIPEDIQTDVFEAFFTTKSPGEGSGLGLYISRKIIEKHRGKITFESQSGHTQFTVFLPIKTGK
jgi:signal transduction histidine kinase